MIVFRYIPYGVNAHQRNAPVPDGTRIQLAYDGVSAFAGKVLESNCVGAIRQEDKHRW
jgi:hypothetical protein